MGAIARVAPDATAFGLRRHPYHLEILGFWGGADQSPANLRWVIDFFGAMHPFDVGEVYVNSLDEGEGHRIRKAYGGNLRSLGDTQSKIRPDELLPLQSEHFASLSGGYIGARPAAR